MHVPSQGPGFFTCAAQSIHVLGKSQWRWPGPEMTMVAMRGSEVRVRAQRGVRGTPNPQDCAWEQAMVFDASRPLTILRCLRCRQSSLTRFRAPWAWMRTVERDYTFSALVDELQPLRAARGSMMSWWPGKRCNVDVDTRMFANLSASACRSPRFDPLARERWRLRELVAQHACQFGGSRRPG